MFKLTYREKRNLFFFIYFFSLLFLSISLVSANIESLGTFKQRQCVSLVQQCSNCSWVNVTSVIYPDSTIALENVQMTKNGYSYNYSFCGTTQLGQYIVNQVADVDGVPTVVAYDFSITTTGSDKISIIPLFLLIGGFAILGLGLYTKEYILGFGSGILLSIAGVYMLIYGLGLFNDLYTQAIAYTSLFIGLIILFASAYEALSD